MKSFSNVQKRKRKSKAEIDEIEAAFNGYQRELNALDFFKDKRRVDELIVLMKPILESCILSQLRKMIGFATQNGWTTYANLEEMAEDGADRIIFRYLDALRKGEHYEKLLKTVCYWMCFNLRKDYCNPAESTTVAYEDLTEAQAPYESFENDIIDNLMEEKANGY